MAFQLSVSIFSSFKFSVSFRNSETHWWSVKVQHFWTRVYFDRTCKFPRTYPVSCIHSILFNFILCAVSLPHSYRFHLPQNHFTAKSPLISNSRHPHNHVTTGLLIALIVLLLIRPRLTPSSIQCCNDFPGVIIFVDFGLLDSVLSDRPKTSYSLTLGFM